MYLPSNVFNHILQFLLPRVPSPHRFNMKHVLDELMVKSEKSQEHDISIIYSLWWFRPREPVGMMIRPKIWGFDHHIRFCLICGEYVCCERIDSFQAGKCTCRITVNSYERWNDVIKLG